MGGFGNKKSGYAAGSFGAGSDGATYIPVFSQFNVGSIVNGEEVPVGSTLQSFAEQLLAGAIFNPVLYQPVFTTTPKKPDLSPLSLFQEVGTLLDLKILFGFSRGSIIGKLVSGVWQSAVLQDYRSGPLVTYRIGGGEAGLGTNNNFELNGLPISEGDNLLEFFADYNVGEQPTNSAGASYSTQLEAGTLQSDITIKGTRAAFFGADSNVVPATTSDHVRSLDGLLVNVTDGSTFTINIEANDSRVTFAFPKSLGMVSSVIDVEGLGLDIKGSFTRSEASVYGANAYAATDYYVYSLIPDVLFTAGRTYQVTI